MFNVSSFFKAWKKFSHGSLLYLVILFAILLFLYKCDKKKRRTAGLAVILIALFVYNPLSYSVLVRIVDASAYRIFWLLPAWAAFSYIAVNCLQLIKTKNLRLFIAVVLSSALMIFCCKTNSYTFSVSNEYQIPGDTIKLADKMIEIMDSRGIENAVLYGNYDFLATLRQYSSRFILHLEPRYHVDMEENARKNNYSGLGQFITTGTSPLEKDYTSDILIDNEVYFIVIYRDLTDSIQYLNSLNWYEITGNDTFVVLCQDTFTETVYDE